MISENKKNGFPDVPLPVSSDGNVGSLPFYKLPHPVISCFDLKQKLFFFI
jgi:hypothetical protein